jgi:hypothetical protein
LFVFVSQLTKKSVFIYNPCNYGRTKKPAHQDNYFGTRLSKTEIFHANKLFVNQF